VNWLSRALTSSIGLKLIAALTGLGLFGFMLVHAQGNLRIFIDDGAAIDAYAEHLHTAWWLPFAEVSLLVLFALHIFTVVKLTLANRAARGQQRYAQSASKRGGGAASASSRTMAVSGLIVLAFLVVHVGFVRLRRENLFHPWFDEATRPHIEPVTVALKAHLSNPLMAGLYVVGSILVCWHLFHGVQSAFRSLGLNHSKYTPMIEVGGKVAAIALGLVFASIPIAIVLGLV
jgi:succinate dehydrogenase / fumarate reductase cytochrome b subunit